MTAEEIIKKLHSNNFEAYLVGGCVRDLILGIESKDKDIVTNASPDEIENIFKNQKIKFVGKSFLVTFVDDIEVATYRKDRYSGYSDKDVNIEKASTLEEDIIRRDLTINGLALDIRNKSIIDYIGGIEDLKNKTIKFIGNPFDRIKEDPNRIIRACRFKAKINGKFDKQTFEALETTSHYVERFVSPERIRIEILKAMLIEKASIFFESLLEIKALQYMFPEMVRCFNHPHGKYHSEHIFQHLMLVGDHISTENSLLKLTGYLHDIGKPKACGINPKTNKMWFNQHEEIGSNILKYDLERLKFSNEEISYIRNLIELHMRSIFSKLTPKGVRRLLRDLNERNIPYDDLIKLQVADRCGNLKVKSYGKDRIRKMYENVEKELNREDPVHIFSNLKVNGYDIMKTLNIPPGKKVGEILKYLFDLVVDNPKLNDKDKLIEIIKDLK